VSLAEDPGFGSLLQRLEGRGLPPLQAYKERCLRRRLAVRMRACGVKTFAEYADVLDLRPGEVDQLLQALTINVTGFFRNPETWARLAAALPDLLAGGSDVVRAWSAGCASGEEAWTTAILLSTAVERTAPGRVAVGVDATDVDEVVLKEARAGEYDPDAFREMPAEPFRRWTEPAGSRVRVRDDLRGMVRFLRHDLAQGLAPDPPYDLVVCRNVLIYFEKSIQQDLFLRFADALRPGGLLLLGKVETLHGPARERLETIDTRERIFRRPA